MVYKPTDFLVRRSGKLYFNIQDVLDYKNAVIDVMADMLNYSETQKEAYTEEVEVAIDEHVQVMINLQLKLNHSY